MINKILVWMIHKVQLFICSVHENIKQTPSTALAAKMQDWVSKLSHQADFRKANHTVNTCTY